MIALDNNLLKQMGLDSLSEDDKKSLLKQMRESLELKVGTQLAERLSETQLDEFGALADKDDADGALKWLQTNCPDYQQVVAREFENLKTEISKTAPQILEATKNA